MTETAGAETVLQALRARRSVGRVKPEQPPRALVERVIEAATWAPNHYHTRPWRFVVVAGEARRAQARQEAWRCRTWWQGWTRAQTCARR